MRMDAIVVPRGAEARAVEQGWGGARAQFVLVPAGASAGRALADVRQIKTALVFGLCGALDPALRVGDVAVYEQIADDGGTIELDPEFARAFARALNCAPVRSANVAAFVATASAKAALRASSGAAAIDMEASAIARALHARGARVAMVRVVSDTADGDAPDLSAVYDAHGTLRPLALAGAFTRRPLLSLRFIANALTALTALRATARRLSA